MNTRRLRPVLAATALVAALGLTACGNGLESSGSATAGLSGGSSTTSNPDPSASPAPSSTGSDASPSPSTGGGSSPSTPSTTGSSAASTSSTSAAGRVGRCTVANLDVGVREPSGGAAAGSTYLLVAFRNTGSRSCVLDGFPGVSFVGKGDGTQLGAAAERTGSARTVTLAPGRSTTSLLQVANAGSYPQRSCAPTTADGFRVYPPGSTEAAFVRQSVQACQGSTGSSPQLVVSSVGTSG
ncbi:DUF4232 domain-containing protein [Arthrobacter sp. NEB 688]|uniref:DUF4232 domain-containing protein n=1 Tax=Arthrobacter sp. NEB 688 TaxID=904039 RepID=UPI001565B79E|nr:DUF4232 domain-containing protein [Arthrobacter sp. NEB 688]QKE83683.1 DUF4232 domain-containing protein [Arthrobacter sp. NEB 688]